MNAQNSQMTVLTQQIKRTILEQLMEQLDAATAEIQMDLRKPRHAGGIIARARVESVWETLPLNPAFAMTTQEIASMTRLPLAIVQKALYILMTEGRAERMVRDKARITDRHAGKSTYEYYRLNIPSEEVPVERKVFDMRALRDAIPQKKKDAKSIYEIADAMSGSAITVRQKMAQLVATGEVGTVNSINKRNQPVIKYYLARSPTPVRI